MTAENAVGELLETKAFPWNWRYQENLENIVLKNWETFVELVIFSYGQLWVLGNFLKLKKNILEIRKIFTYFWNGKKENKKKPEILEILTGKLQNSKKLGKS